MTTPVFDRFPSFFQSENRSNLRFRHLVEAYRTASNTGGVTVCVSGRGTSSPTCRVQPSCLPPTRRRQKSLIRGPFVRRLGVEISLPTSCYFFSSPRFSFTYRLTPATTGGTCLSPSTPSRTTFPVSLRPLRSSEPKEQPRINNGRGVS